MANRSYHTDSVIENGVHYEDSVNGGHDVWNYRNGHVDDPASSSSADHLVVMVNGILGSANDWKFGAEQFVKSLPDKVFVHCSVRNVSKLTLDGVDVMGERLAEEVLELIRQKPNLRKISFVAHSIGGLVARYAIGKLYQPSNGGKMENLSINGCDESSTVTIGGLEAMNFITVATPHLGSRGNKHVPFLFGLPAIEKLASLVIHLIFRRTGKHLFLVDNDDGKPPLLKRMVHDDYDHPFMCVHILLLDSFIVPQNLSLFFFIDVWLLADTDIVGWRTSCIRRMSELPKWEDSVNENYPHVVLEEHCSACDGELCESDSLEDPDKIEEEILTCLSRVSWEKVDVSFHASRQRFAAHSVIQVKDSTMHAEGADVIQHMIDHFEL